MKKCELKYFIEIIGEISFTNSAIKMYEETRIKILPMISMKHFKLKFFIHFYGRISKLKSCQ
jgi:hypothetical protein